MYNNNPYNRNNITWVQGMEAAKAFQMMPGSNIVLMDSEADRFYIKSCDNIGMCNLRVFKFEEITNAQPKSEYVTRDEVIEIINSLRGESNEQTV